jgi:hypothetical protein
MKQTLPFIVIGLLFFANFIFAFLTARSAIEKKFFCGSTIGYLLSSFFVWAFYLWFLWSINKEESFAGWNVYDCIFFFGCCTGIGILVACICQNLPFLSPDSIEAGEEEDEEQGPST